MIVNKLYVCQLIVDLFTIDLITTLLIYYYSTIWEDRIAKNEIQDLESITLHIKWVWKLWLRNININQVEFFYVIKYNELTINAIYII